jgi:DNA-binding MarR family transcriptional regulator
MNEAELLDAMPAPACAERDPLFFGILRAAQALQGRLEEALTEVGLSPAKFEVLHQLARAGDSMPLRALAVGQRCVPSNMTQLVDRLESDGLVRRVADPADRRIVRAVLTPEGRERAAAGAEAVGRVQRAFSAALAPADRAALERVLSALR